MEINGLPAHPLLVHLVVVLLPLSAVAAVVASAWPAAQRKLTFLVPLGAALGAAAVPLTTRAGDDLAASLGNPEFIAHHRELGDSVLPWAVAFAVAALVQWLYLRRDRPALARVVLGLLVTASAVGTVVVVVLTGDSGAQAVWGGR